MRAVVIQSCWRPWSRLAVLGVLTAGVAACSADTTRFSNSNWNPFASQSSAPSEVTGSLQPAPSSHIAAQALPPPPVTSRPASIPTTGVSGGGQGMASYTPAHVPTLPAHDITGSVARAPAPRHGVPAAEPAGSTVHVVAPGETLMSLSRRYHKPLGQIAAANHIPPQTHVRIGDRIVIPGHAMTAHAPPPPEPPKVQATRAPTLGAAPRIATASEIVPTARVAAAGMQATAQSGAATTAAAPAFRWPVRGRVIAGFAAKTNGQANDGIDLAVPEGTAVHAAEDGVVAYAGNELKGYGNLILIRHSNGFVTAYAHASEILVKRNDPVRRGQVIAKSGQTGGVATPQLHFEIRKGSSPVDPSQYLPAA